MEDIHGIIVHHKIRVCAFRHSPLDSRQSQHPGWVLSQEVQHLLQAGSPLAHQHLQLLMKAFGGCIGEADAFHLLIEPGRASVRIAGHGHVKPLRVLLKVAQNLVRRLF